MDIQKHKSLFMPRLVIFFAVIIFFYNTPILQAGQNKNAQVEKNDAATLETILKKVELQYSSDGFSADFYQESTIKAMEITDTAEGKALFKYPGMMRWTYEKPEPQQIITDGNTLWIYRPDDNQTMIGKADVYFGRGSGASFLTDIKNIKRDFKIYLEKSKQDNTWRIQLKPLKESPDLESIILTISKKTYVVSDVSTFNSFGDETRIIFSHIKFNKNIDNSSFKFNIPVNCDLMYLEEKIEN